MRPPTRREALLALSSTVVVAVLVVWLPDRDPLVGAAGETSGSVQATTSFTISGDLRGAITPGAVVPLELSIENPDDVELAVGAITVAVLEVDAPRADPGNGCGVQDFAVRQVPEGVVLNLGRQRTEDLGGLGLARDEWPAVGLRDRRVNQDGCQGAVLTLGYEATGTEVRR